MKKTLKILSAISLTTPLSVSVIACGPDNNVKPSYLTDLGFETNEAYSLSSTTAILSSGTNQKAWFFDSSKPVGSQLTDLNHFINTFYRLSDKTGIFLLDTTIGPNKNAWFFDITSGQPVNTDLKQDLNLQTIKILSTTTAIVNTDSFKTLFLNVANITTTPFIQLDQVLRNFYPLSETTGIGIGSNDKTYYFEYK